MLYYPHKNIWIPSYDIQVPLSPPAQRRKERIDSIIKDTNLIRCPGLAPEAYREWKQWVLPSAISNHRRSLGAGTVVGIPSLQDAKWYYKFEDSTWKDSTSNNNTLTAHNTPTIVAGQVGNAANFVSSSSQYLDIAYNSAYNLGTSGSIAGWINITSGAPNFGRFLWKTSIALQVDYGISFNSTRLFFSFSRASDGVSNAVSANTFGQWTASTWYFFCAKADPSTNLAYISINNGTFDSIACAQGLHNAANGTFAVGRDDFLNLNCLSGKVDEIGGWARIISSTEISNLYNSGLGNSVF